MASNLHLHVPSLTDGKTYESYKKELKAWQKITKVAKKEQGLFVALSLPETSYKDINIQELMTESVLDIPIIAIVDNKSVVDCVHSTKAVEDKKLRIDVGSVKEMLKRGVISGVHWVPGSEMVADVLTKKGVANFEVLDLLQNGEMSIQSDVY